MAWLPLIAAPGTSQFNAFLARTTGLSATERTAYFNLISGLNRDGTWPLLDALYIFATNTTTTANLNLVSASFTLTPIGASTFVVDVGYTGNGSASGFDTGLITGTNFTQNSASLGIAIQTNDTTSQTMMEMGTTDSGGAFAVLGPSYTLQSYYALNGTFNTLASTTSKGMWGTSRTAASGAGALSLYSNGSATPLASVNDATLAAPSQPIFICGRNNGAGGFNNASSRQISAAWIGGGLTGAQYLLIANRINAYLTVFGINVY
jgi:hypothetical protein